MAKLVELEYSGREDHVQDEVAPYNDGNRRVNPGDKVAVPEETAQYLEIFEGWNRTDADAGEDDADEQQQRAQEQAEQELAGVDQEGEDPNPDNDEQEQENQGSEGGNK